MKTYLIEQNEKEAGPFTTKQLRSLWRAGQITIETKVREKGEQDWTLMEKLLPIVEPSFLGYRESKNIGLLLSLLVGAVLVTFWIPHLLIKATTSESNYATEWKAKQNAEELKIYTACTNIFKRLIPGPVIFSPLDQTFINALSPTVHVKFVITGPTSTGGWLNKEVDAYLEKMPSDPLGWRIKSMSSKTISISGLNALPEYYIPKE